MKMNKKGFTLIEMLVVIAIIAILVAIVIPTVSTATKKAAYATDAANLRATEAEAKILYLGGLKADGTTKIASTDTEIDYSGLATWTPKSGLTTVVCKVNTSTGAWTVTLGGKTITQLSGGAETGTLGS